MIKLNRHIIFVAALVCNAAGSTLLVPDEPRSTGLCLIGLSVILMLDLIASAIESRKP